MIRAAARQKYVQLVHNLSTGGLGTTLAMMADAALTSACKKAKQPEQAMEVFHAMQRQGVVPGVIMYNALISACEKGKQPE